MKKVLYIAVSFLTAFLIFVFGAALTGAVATSEAYIKTAIKNSEYTKKVSIEIADKMQDIAIPSGLPQDFFDDKIKTDYINTTIDKCVSAATKGEEYAYNNEEIVELVYNDILEYAKEKNIDINEESKGMLLETASLSAEFYSNYTYKLFYKILGFINNVSKLLFIAAGVLFVIIVAICMVLLKKEELSFALMGGGVMLLVATVLMLSSSLFKLSISSAAVVGFINTFLGGVATIIGILGAIFVVLGIVSAKFILKRLAK